MAKDTTVFNIEINGPDQTIMVNGVDISASVENVAVKDGAVVMELNALHCQVSVTGRLHYKGYACGSADQAEMIGKIRALLKAFEVKNPPSAKTKKGAE